MCLLLPERQATPSIATEDMVVYKLLKYSYLFHVWRSPFFDHQEWVRGETYTTDECEWQETKVEAAIGCPIRGGFLKNGYHSESSLLTMISCYSLRGRRVFKAIIPKGSEYYMGPRGNVISRQLRIVRKLWFNLF